ncbi:hypothetical protein [Zooshikella harenae]|uniref:Alpha/beta hydrolase n=1 Tax=Zooshikella harenae TaxID=2827238 RepID=A0ABS5ZG15_9GAMM|nr:hypothetical protein [Zooshikella harenae]MBU2712910.1 hypothetical protein [Zooshikella harenae]
MGKRIIVVHGRAAKPKQNEKYRLVYKALSHGLSRYSDEVAQMVISKVVPIELVYFGDVTNALIWASHQRPQKKIVTDFLTQWDYSYEQNGRYDAAMESLFDIKQQSSDAYSHLKFQLNHFSSASDSIGFISHIVNLLGVNDEIINSIMPDLGAYFKYRIIGSLIRYRLQELLVPALHKGDDICIISHSLGCVVAYDVLWKLSRMSEYNALHDKKINLFITVGSPLGEPAVAKQLYDVHEPEDGRYPRNISEWHNFSAADDFVSRDIRHADCFYPMYQRQLVDLIQDHIVYNFWVGEHGLNPHKFYGYLDNLSVTRIIAEWLMH